MLLASLAACLLLFAVVVASLLNMAHLQDEAREGSTPKLAGETSTSAG